jgi:hypothetical protein
MPEFLEVREVQVHVDQPGFRTESLVVVTTLLDAQEYSREDLAELYHQRWLAELDIRAIKIQLGMDVLRCQSPEMVRKEIWTCLRAYNLIRKTILESAKRSDLSPRQIRFTAAMQKVAASWESVLLLSEASLALLVEEVLVGKLPLRLDILLVRREAGELSELGRQDLAILLPMRIGSSTAPLSWTRNADGRLTISCRGSMPRSMTGRMLPPL